MALYRNVDDLIRGVPSENSWDNYIGKKYYLNLNFNFTIMKQISPNIASARLNDDTDTLINVWVIRTDFHGLINAYYTRNNASLMKVYCLTTPNDGDEYFVALIESHECTLDDWSNRYPAIQNQELDMTNFLYPFRFIYIMLYIF